MKKLTEKQFLLLITLVCSITVLFMLAYFKAADQRDKLYREQQLDNTRDVLLKCG